MVVIRIIVKPIDTCKMGCLVNR